MKKNYFFLAIILFLTNSIYSQQCGFDIERSKLRQSPEYVALEKAAEQRIQAKIKSGDLSKSSSHILTIPIVIHVLHLGEAEGTGTNISTAQIQSSIDNLNDFYGGQTPGNDLDFKIQFTLAKRDPDCNATSGINRIDASGVTDYATDGVAFRGAGADENTLKDLSRWPETNYFNIWIVTEIDGNNGGFGFQGYANFYNGNTREGSVMMHTVFGYDPTDAAPSWPLSFSRDNSTVVHEAGHYFHLYHTFQGDEDGDVCPADVTVGNDSDGCADTVPHKRETSSCPAQNSCTTANWQDDNTINNIMSYYSCTDKMTNDQKTRVRAAMEGTLIVNSKGSLAPDLSYAAPMAVCSTNSSAPNNYAGILSVELNGVTFISSSTEYDGGNIDNSGSCTDYFEIDASVANTLSVGLSPNDQQLGVWIDWNDDGDFDDDAEQQYLANDIPANSTVPILLTYPITIPYGDYVRIRLIEDLDDRYSEVDLISSACYSSLKYGQSEDYTIYVKPAAAANWTGTVNTDWTTSGNWDTGVVPTGANHAVISNVPVNQPVIGATTGALVNDLTVADGASLSVTNGGSLIVNATSTGAITYNLAIPDTNWHLVSSPVVGEQYNDTWVTDNSIAISGSTGNRGVSTYNNTTPHVTTEHWRYFAGGSTENFVSGIGYSNLRTAAGNYSFTGTFPTADIVSTISQNDQNWNLIGNPYPSYIDIDAFITANTANLSGAFQAVYVWDGASYANLTTGYIHPGQGFFVNSNIPSGTASITKAMQSHQTGVTIYKTATPSITVTLSDGTSSKETQINYLQGKTKGLDPRFDIGLFDGASSNLRMYTHLLKDNQGIKFSRQALPNSDLESMIVPVGVKANAGKEISFSLEAVNLPADINVFLEDKVASTITRLDEENTAYNVILSEALNGVGRFFLHTSSEILEVSNLDLVSVSIYSSDKKIHLSELPNGVSKITLYNAVGKVVLKESTMKNRTSISVKNLSKGGIYIVKLITEKGLMSKKIIIE